MQQPMTKTTAEPEDTSPAQTYAGPSRARPRRRAAGAAAGREGRPWATAPPRSAPRTAVEEGPRRTGWEGTDWEGWTEHSQELRAVWLVYGARFHGGKYTCPQSAIFGGSTKW